MILLKSEIETGISYHPIRSNIYRNTGISGSELIYVLRGRLISSVKFRKYGNNGLYFVINNGNRQSQTIRKAVIVR